MAKVNIVSRTAQRLLLSRSYSLNFSKWPNVWTSDNIVKSPFPDVVIPNRTIPEHIWENMEKWADKTALECGITNRSYTYHQLYKYSRNFAANLRMKLKIRKNDVVCIMMPNSPEYALAVLGAIEAGAEVTTVNPLYTPHEVHRQLTLSKPKVVIVSPETIVVLKEALQLIRKEIPIIAVNNSGDINGAISFHELAFHDNVDISVLNEVEKNPDDVALLLYSSGTTGLPKGVELTNRNIVVNCVQQDAEGVKHYDDTTASYQESVMGVLPFYHTYGLSVIMLHKLSIGAKVVTLPKFYPNTFLNAMKEKKISILIAAPPLILFLGSHANVKEEHLSSIKTLTNGASSLPKYDIDMVLEKVKQKINFLQLYGLTETSPLATAMIPGSDDYTTAGFAIPNTELRIVDNNSNSLGPNEVGELYIRGPQIMKGYKNNPEATKETITYDGWLKSGDLAKLDKYGAVTIVGRLKELIKVKGYQVPPAELESILKEHPSVLDVAVVGKPDKKSGEVPIAFIVLKDGQEVEAKDVINFLAERVTDYKKVKEVIFLDSLPRNPSGKILRRVLQDRYC